MKHVVYTVTYRESVGKELRKVPAKQRAEIVKRILLLATNPRPEGSVKLHGSTNLYRMRYSEYRIIYQVKNKELVILIVKVGHRREVHRDM